MKKIIIKKKKKLVVKKKPKKVKKKVEKQADNLEEMYLKYDLDIDAEFRKTLKSGFDKKLDMDLINKLPQLDTDNIFQNEEDPLIKIRLKVEKPRENSIDIDVDSLDKQEIGNKTYYIDYDKGIIYDTNLLAVGNIGEFGEINI